MIGLSCIGKNCSEKKVLKTSRHNKHLLTWRLLCLFFLLGYLPIFLYCIFRDLDDSEEEIKQQILWNILITTTIEIVTMRKPTKKKLVGDILLTAKSGRMERSTSKLWTSLKHDVVTKRFTIRFQR